MPFPLHRLNVKCVTVLASVTTASSTAHLDCVVAVTSEVGTRVLKCSQRASLKEKESVCL